MHTLYSRDLKSGFVVRGKFLNSCIDVLRKYDLIDKYFPTTVTSAPNKGLRYLYYRDLYYIANEIKMPISDFLEVGFENECEIHLRDFPDVMTTGGIMDRKILTTLDTIAHKELTELKRYINLISGMPWNYYGPYEISKYLSPNIRIKMLANLKESYGELSSCYCNNERWSARGISNKHNFIFKHEDILKMTFHLSGSPRWVFVIPTDISFWGYHSEVENVYDTLKLLPKNKQKLILDYIMSYTV